MIDHMAVQTIIPELSWICALLFLVVVFLLVLTCVCFKDHEKAEYGTVGRLSITRDSPVLQRQSRNGAISTGSRQSDLNSDDGGTKRNSWTVKDRALPEIPGTTIVPISVHSAADDGSLPVSTERTKAKSHKTSAPKPPGSDPSKVFPLNGSALLPSASTGSGVTVTITVNDKTQIIGNPVKSRVPPTDPVPGTSSDTVILKKIEKVDALDNPPKSDDNIQELNVYDTVPEIPFDRSSQSTSMSSSPVLIKIGNPTPSEEGSSSNLSASLAVAGAVPSSDIPYMTPPLLHNIPPPVVNEEADEETRARGEIPYTVISVREPLARVREITLRRQRAAAQQNPVDDDHYAMVPEEEQMYAEIGSGHESASSSITYAHIEPRELPPVPPTVESLKSVAHAHSRQASTVSTSSVGSCLSGFGGESSPPTLRNPSASLYSTVEKNNKQRKTIHLAEGVSVVASVEKRKKVEDLYAKVRKKKVDLSIRTSGSDDYSAYQGIADDDDVSCITPPPSPWASTTPPAPPPITGRLQAASLSVLLPGNSQHVRRHSADPNLPEIINENRVFTGSTRGSVIVSNNESDEPNYERIYNENEDNSGDSCYEKIKEETETHNKSNVGYESIHHRNAVLTEGNYPGYESVKDLNEDEDSLEPGYERVARSNGENDPCYEPVRVPVNFDDSDSNSDYTIAKSDNSCSGYERVKYLGRSESDAADPGYEKIKKMPRADSDATDPGYERVRNKEENPSEPGYETVQRSDSDTDPAYEVVPQNRFISSRYSNNNLTSSSPNSNSTVVFVSGDSEVYLSGNYNARDQSSRPDDANATFL